MEINKRVVLYFSACGSTKQLLDNIDIYDKFTDEIVDLTECELPVHLKQLDKNTLLIIAFPVYAGRVPVPFIRHLQALEKANCPAVIIATYGGRHYDDALVEMQDFLSERACKLVGAVAVVAEHSIVREIAANRPDKQDLEIMAAFKEKVKNKIENYSIEEMVDVSLPGNRPYKPYKLLPFRPFGTKKCTYCELCVKHCPQGAIEKDEPRKTKKDLCISCMRCVSVCPVKARRYRKIDSFIAKRFLKKVCPQYAETKIFV